MRPPRRRAVGAGSALALAMGVIVSLGACRDGGRDGHGDRRPDPSRPVPVTVPAAAPPAAPDDRSVPVAWGDSSRIIVEVLNASRVRGLGRQATAVLRDRGLDVVFTANAPDTVPRDSTLILARGRGIDRAERVRRALGEGRVEARPDASRDVDVTVLLGRRWRPPPEPFHP